MQPRTLAFVFCRAFALVLIFGQVLPLEGFMHVVSIVQYGFLSDGVLGSLLALLVPLVLLLAPAALLWWKADWLSRKIAPAVPDADVAPGSAPPAWPVHALQRIVFSGIGALLVVGGLRKVWAESARAMFTGRSEGLDAIQLSPTNLADAAFLLVCGLVLLFGAGRFLAFVRYLRRAGR